MHIVASGDTGRSKKKKKGNEGVDIIVEYAECGGGTKDAGEAI